MILNKEHMYFGAACLIAGVVLGAGFRSCKQGAKLTPATPSVIHDTLIIRDSSQIDAHTKPKYIIRRDTMWLPMPASTCNTADYSYNPHITDSIAVEIPIMNYEYRDTFATDSSLIELGVQFSGYKARIDNIDLRYRFETEPQTVIKKKGWGQFIGVGIGVGYGASVVNQRVYAAPEVGIHITYGWGYHW